MLTKALIVPAAILLVVLYWYVIGHWRFGFRALLYFLPFTGLPVLVLPSPLGVLFKDFVLVIPTYVGFWLWLHLHKRQLPPLPAAPVICMLALTTLALIQLANPGIPNELVGLIGLKVWLFYLPLYFLAYSFCETREDIAKIGRVLVALSFLPAAVGLLEFVLSFRYGYETTMTMFYGAHAADFTQRFSHFAADSDMLLFRIPATFSFATQYYDFVMGMIPVAFFVMRTDPGAKWRRVAKFGLFILLVAGLTSGSRQAFIFLPLELGILTVLTYNLNGVLVRLGTAAFAGLLLYALIGPKLNTLFEYEAALFGHYESEIAVGGLAYAIDIAPFGRGTGTNTGAARYAFTADEDFTGIENYYAKAAYELGVVGLAVVAGLLVAIVFNGTVTWRLAETSQERIMAGSLIAFVIVIALNSFKGWALDLDPLNVYFWTFAGFLAKLRYLA